MTIDRIRAVSFTKGLGNIIPIRIEGYRFFSDEYVAGAGNEIDFVIEGYGNDNIFDGSYEIGVAQYNALGEIQRISTTYSSTGVGVPHNFQSDYLIIAVGVTRRAIQRLIDSLISVHNSDGAAHTAITSAINAHIANVNNPHNVTKAQVGLANADNTADVDKPISSATQTALNLKANQADLIAHTSDLNNPHSTTKAQVGLSNVDNTSDLLKPISNATQSAIDLKANSTDLNLHVSDLTNPHEVTKTQIGLSNVDNTSDASKPISIATQAALDLKTNTSLFQSHASATNNPHGVTAFQVGLGNANNTSDADKPISTATQIALNLKEDIANKGQANGYAPLNGLSKIDSIYLPSLGVTDHTALSNIGTNTHAQIDTAISNSVSHIADLNNPHAVTKTQIGLSNVDNTSDANKPVSSAQQIAIDAKVADAITDGVLTIAPSQNAVFDALAGKANSSHSHVIADVTNLQTELDGKEDSFLYNNATPMPSTVGGFNSGTTFTNQTLNQMFTGLLYPYQLPTFTSFAISGQSTTLEAGEAIASGAKTFTWATSNPSNINVNSIEIRNHTDNTSLASGLANDGTESVSLPSPIIKTTATSHTFRINGTNSQSTVFSRDFTVNWRFRIYYGESALTSLNESQIESLRVSSLVANSNGTFSFNPLGYKWFCYPTSFGLKTTFKDTSTNLDVAMEAAVTISVTNAFGVTVNYYAHRTTNQLGGAINIAVS